MAKPQNPPGAGANGQGGHGDIDALYRAHAGDLVAWLRKMFGDGPSEPEDGATGLPQAHGAPGPRRHPRSQGVLWQTARNICLNSLAGKATRQRHAAEIQRQYYPSGADPATPAGALLAINAALRRMPEQRRHAFLLHR